VSPWLGSHACHCRSLDLLHLSFSYTQQLDGAGFRSDCATSACDLDGHYPPHEHARRGDGWITRVRLSYVSSAVELAVPLRRQRRAAVLPYDAKGSATASGAG
jgi:hypothetical protein